METIITVLVTLCACANIIAFVQVYKSLKGKIADLENIVHEANNTMYNDSVKVTDDLYREIDILQQKLESNIDSRADNIINKFSEHVSDVYRQLDTKVDKLKK